MKRLKILFAFPENSSVYGMRTPRLARKFREILNVDCDIVFPKTYNEEELVRLARDANVIIGAKWFPRKAIALAKELRLIHTTGAGVDTIPFDSLQGRNVLVANTSGASAVTVAEHVFALITALSKNIVTQHLKMKEETWQRIKSVELFGKVLGIIGLGNIGIEVAKRGKAFGMSILYFSRTRKRDVEKNIGVKYVDFDTLLKASDFVTLHVPLTGETCHLIGRRELGLMKKTSYLINTSRGPVVDEKALYEALLNKQIAGAGIDTWYNSPPYYIQYKKVYHRYPPSRLSIHRLDKVICTPHVAGYSNEFVERALRLIAKNIKKHLLQNTCY